jgi:hypothetical protein
VSVDGDDSCIYQSPKVPDDASNNLLWSKIYALVFVSKERLFTIGVLN